MPASKNLHRSDRSGSKLRTRPFDPKSNVRTTQLNGANLREAANAEPIDQGFSD